MQKLLFVYDSAEEPVDGLHAALNILSREFEVTKLNIRSEGWPVEEYDFVLGHGAFNSPVDKLLQESKGKKGLCIGGNAYPPVGAENYDILFCETNWIKDVYLRGVKTKKVVAFGVNTDIFSLPGLVVPIVWDYTSVGAFASWKNFDRMIEKAKKGHKCLVVGEVQEENLPESMGIITNLVRNGVMVSPQVHPLDLVNLYSWSRTLFMPSSLIGGGERAVLEARSCGLKIEIDPTNIKLKELVELDPIPSHFDYSNSLKSGTLSVL